MGKPTNDELESAFQEAKRLIWQEQDQRFLAKCLFALHDQWEELSKVLSACNAYIRSGYSTTAHRNVISALNGYRKLFSENNSDYVVNVTPEELNIAIMEAGRLRESGNDSMFIGKTVLNLNYMVKQLETVHRALERYLHSGKANSEQQNLEKAVKAYQTTAGRAERTNPQTFSVY